MAEKRAKRAETSEHNTEHKATPSTPDNRAKPKAKTGPSPKRSPGPLPPVPPMPTGEKASGSQDNPGSTHESKGKRGRPRNTQGPPPVRKDDKNKRQEKPNPIPTPNPTPNPKHDTDVTNSTDCEFWKGQNFTIIKDQLNKINYRDFVKGEDAQAADERKSYRQDDYDLSGNVGLARRVQFNPEHPRPSN